MYSSSNQSREYTRERWEPAPNPSMAKSQRSAQSCSQLFTSVSTSFYSRTNLKKSEESFINNNYKQQKSMVSSNTGNAQSVNPIAECPSGSVRHRADSGGSADRVAQSDFGHGGNLAGIDQKLLLPTENPQEHGGSEGNVVHHQSPSSSTSLQANYNNSLNQRPQSMHELAWKLQEDAALSMQQNARKIPPGFSSVPVSPVKSNPFVPDNVSHVFAGLSVHDSPPMMHSNQQQNHQQQLYPQLQQQLQQQQSFSATPEFNDDVKRINEWFVHLSERDAVVALQSILQNMNPEVLGALNIRHLSSQRQRTRTANTITSNVAGGDHGSAKVVHYGAVGQKYPTTPQSCIVNSVHTLEKNDLLDMRRSISIPPEQYLQWSTPSSSPGESGSFFTPALEDVSPTSSINGAFKFDGNRGYPSTPQWHLEHAKAQQQQLQQQQQDYEGIRRRVQTTPISMYKSHGSQSAKVQHKSPELPYKTDKGKIPETVDFELFEDVPAWLRSLRLHKYTNLFAPSNRNGKHWHWREMVELSDEQLEQMGIGALGARRKLLRVFEMVKHALEYNNQN
ncbi:hypothetical protein MIR68_011171 [Amoeboaphelidium protococcarum]|nr:hypothetical protein MIR68_011171 [Amoeboaphelidium protococcarum]